MSDRINLTLLREHALYIDRVGTGTAYIKPDELLTLIDTVEAAGEDIKHSVAAPNSGTPGLRARAQLLRTLNRYTIT